MDVVDYEARIPYKQGMIDLPTNPFHHHVFYPQHPIFFIALKHYLEQHPTLLDAVIVYECPPPEPLPLYRPPVKTKGTKWFRHPDAGGYRLQFGMHYGSKINEIPMTYLWYCYEKKKVCTSMPWVLISNLE